MNRRSRSKCRHKTLLSVAAVLTGAAATANGYRPLLRRRYGSALSWASGLLVSELPTQALACLLAAAVITTRRLSARSRLFAWLVTGLSGLGLVGLDRIGRRSDVVLTAALDAGLGTERRTDSAELWNPPRRDAVTARRSGVVRTMRIWRNYAHDTDISYGEQGKANLLDIWRRPDLEPHGKAPVLLQVPGGAWSTGSKRGQAHPLMSHLTELGWVCVSVNYRLSPRHTWPDHIVDIKRVIVWVKHNIARYGGDADFIAITGGSAGGHLSSLAALTPNDPQFQPGFTDADTAVQAAVPFYGVYDFTRTDGALHDMMLPFLERRVIKQLRADAPTAFAAASTVGYAGRHAPPFFILHGNNDSFIPVEQARSFAARLREVSEQPVVYAELPYAQHAFDILSSARAAHAAVAVEQFLAEIYSARSGT